MTKIKQRILVIDFMNCFIRNFTQINRINPQTQHIGGLVGFLKSVGYMSRIIKPNKIIIAFEGIGSVRNKQNIFPDYKKNRNPNKINNTLIFDDKEDEKNSMHNQINRLIEYLKCLPVSLVSLDKYEADDIIGLITETYLEDEIIILSADKDFIQLVNDNVSIYNPFKKRIITKKEIIEEYNIPPINFKIYKTLLGDPADNIPGVPKLGPKKIIKLFPEITQNEPLLLEKVFEICSLNLEKNKLYSQIVAFKHQLMINYDLVNLNKIQLFDNDAELLDISLNNTPYLNINNFISLFVEDKLQNEILNINNWLINSFGII